MATSTSTPTQVIEIMDTIGLDLIIPPMGDERNVNVEFKLNGIQISKDGTNVTDDFLIEDTTEYTHISIPTSSN